MKGPTDKRSHCIRVGVENELRPTFKKERITEDEITRRNLFQIAKDFFSGMIPANRKRDAMRKAARDTINICGHAWAKKMIEDAKEHPEADVDVMELSDYLRAVDIRKKNEAAMVNAAEAGERKHMFDGLAKEKKVLQGRFL